MIPKRSLGQNFLRNKHLAESIVRYVTTSSPTKILEIGPGTGVFTHLFIKQGIAVTAIEKDDELSKVLSSLGSSELRLINQDVLELGRNLITDLIDNDDQTVCFGALPYNISKKIISHIVPMGIFPEYYFIIQKEVAEKYSATNKGNRLSAFISAFAGTKMIMNIAPSNFYPVPKVNSALLQFKRLPKPLIEPHENLLYESFTKALYNNPRKMLNKNPIFKHFSVPDQLSHKRPEELSLEEIIELFTLIK